MGVRFHQRSNSTSGSVSTGMGNRLHANEPLCNQPPRSIRPGHPCVKRRMQWALPKSKEKIGTSRDSPVSAVSSIYRVAQKSKLLYCVNSLLFLEPPCITWCLVKTSVARWDHVVQEDYFLAAQRTKARPLLSECLSVRPSVCLSHSWVTRKRFKTSELHFTPYDREMSSFWSQISQSWI